MTDVRPLPTASTTHIPRTFASSRNASSTRNLASSRSTLLSVSTRSMARMSSTPSSSQLASSKLARFQGFPTAAERGPVTGEHPGDHIARPSHQQGGNLVGRSGTSPGRQPLTEAMVNDLALKRKSDGEGDRPRKVVRLEKALPTTTQPAQTYPRTPGTALTIPPVTPVRTTGIGDTGGLYVAPTPARVLLQQAAEALNGDELDEDDDMEGQDGMFVPRPPTPPRLHDRTPYKALHTTMGATPARPNAASYDASALVGKTSTTPQDEPPPQDQRAMNRSPTLCSSSSAKRRLDFSRANRTISGTDAALVPFRPSTPALGVPRSGNSTTSREIEAESSMLDGRSGPAPGSETMLWPADMQAASPRRLLGGVPRPGSTHRPFASVPRTTPASPGKMSTLSRPDVPLHRPVSTSAAGNIRTTDGRSSRPVELDSTPGSSTPPKGDGLFPFVADQHHETHAAHGTRVELKAGNRTEWRLLEQDHMDVGPPTSRPIACPAAAAQTATVRPTMPPPSRIPTMKKTTSNLHLAAGAAVPTKPVSSLSSLPERRPSSRPTMQSSKPLQLPTNSTASTTSSAPLRRKPSYPSSLSAGAAPSARQTPRMVSVPVPAHILDRSESSMDLDHSLSSLGVRQSPRSVSDPVPRERLSLSMSSRREGWMDTSKSLVGLSEALERLKVKKDGVGAKAGRPLAESVNGARVERDEVAARTTSVAARTTSVAASVTCRTSLVAKPRVSVTSEISISIEAEAEPKRDSHLADPPRGRVGTSGCLKGVVAFVDVWTSDGTDSGKVFGELLRGLGAKVLGRPTDTCTHIIYKSGRPSTLSWYRKQEDPPHIVGISWVTKSKEAGRRLDEEGFAIEVGQEDVFQKRRKSMEPKQLALTASVGLSRSSLLGPGVSEARRRSLMFAPRISSPLKKGYRMEESEEE